MSYDDPASAMSTSMQTVARQAREAREAAPQQAKELTASALSTVDRYVDKAGRWTQDTADLVTTRQQRQDFLDRIQAFSSAYPILSTFLAVNLALTGPPTLIFLLFSLGTFAFSLTAGIVAALAAATLFTMGCIGLALWVIVPTVIFTTIVACSLWFWGMVGYLILSWVNGNTASDSTVTKGSKPLLGGSGSVGNSVPNFSGGRTYGGQGAGADQKALSSEQPSYVQPEKELRHPHSSVHRMNQSSDLGQSDGHHVRAARPAEDLPSYMNTNTTPTRGDSVRTTGAGTGGTVQVR